MHPDIQNHLVALNRNFYSEYAVSFSASREKLQSGVIKVADTIPADANILDLGCGNGNFLNYLIRHEFSGSYFGVDISEALLKKAEELNRPFSQIVKTFSKADLTSNGWARSIVSDPFDVITAFAVLHHIPGAVLRQQLLAQIHELLATEGHFVFSTWQFQNSAKLRKRILPWETVGLKESNVEEGDTLLDWRAEMGESKVGTRYVHRFTEEELNDLRVSSGFTLEDCFYSDGREGNLALYQVWKKN